MIRSNDKGFTIFEMIGVVLIFSFLMLVFLPNMLGMLSTFRLEAAANSLANDLSRAKMYAIMSGEDVVVSFYEIRNKPSFYKINSRIVYDELEKGKNNTLLPQKIELPREISFTSLPDNNEIRFNREGVPLPGGTIRATDSRGKSLYVIIARSGRVRVANIP